MCNRYVSPEEAEVERFWGLTARDQRQKLWQGLLTVYPRAPGPFIRRQRDVSGYERELVVGQWGLIPWFAKESKLKYPTNNACSEELEAKASYKDPWKRGQRCIIPAASFDEPNWESGKNQWWTFRRADGEPWGLAGLCNVWVNKATGEVHESYTMLTINADEHPLMSRMHKSDPKLAPDKQDKRSVSPLEAAHFDQWLEGTVEEAKAFMKLPLLEVFEAGSA